MALNLECEGYTMKAILGKGYAQFKPYYLSQNIFFCATYLLLILKSET